MTQREGAAVLERYLSSRSPPDHLLYQMLKIVPVAAGASGLKVAGSTCGLAGRRLRRMIFLIFLPSALVVMSGVSVVVGMMEVDGFEGSSVRSFDAGAVAVVGGGVCTSAMVAVVV